MGSLLWSPRLARVGSALCHRPPRLPRRAAGLVTGFVPDSGPLCAAPQVRSVIRGHSRWRYATLILTRHFDDRPARGLPCPGMLFSLAPLTATEDKSVIVRGGM